MDLLLYALTLISQAGMYAVVHKLPPDSNPAITQGVSFPSNCTMYANDRAMILACTPTSTKDNKVTLYVSDVTPDYSKNVDYKVIYVPDSISVNH